jgi:hypothetical protein
MPQKSSRFRLVRLTAVLLTAALGGCAAYSSYPPTAYSYNYPSGYYTYPQSYTYVPEPAPVYSPSFSSYYNTYGGNGN